MFHHPALRRALTGAALAGLLAGGAIWWATPELLVRGAGDRIDSFLPLLTRLIQEDLDQPAGALQARVRALTRGSDLRLTLMAEDGVVLADSERTADQVRRMENHAGRPEVRQALALGRGEGRRRSRTTGREYIYLARRILGPGGSIYVLRLAQPLRQVPLAAVEQLRLALPPILLAALLGAALGVWIDRRTHRPIRRLAGAVERGDATAHGPDGSEAVAELAAGIWRLVADLRSEGERLTGERDRLLAILDAMSDGILVARRGRRVELVNPAFRELFAAQEPSDDTEPTLLDLSRSPDLVGFVEQLFLPEGVIEERIDSEAGRTLELRGLQLEGDRALVVARDLSDEVRLDQTRRDLVANVSHELRTPLTAIRGFTENLRDGALDEPETARRFVDRILAQCARLEALLGDLLALSRLESDDPRGEAGLQPVDLLKLAGKVFETLAVLAEEREVRLELRGEPAIVRGSPEALERMLVNLVENAIRHNRQGGDVNVAVERWEGGTVVEVADTGVGISPRDLPRIFERFFRVDGGRARREGGTGLGLAIVKHAAQIHGGRVEVASDLGRGSVFRVVLPATDD